MKTLVVFYSRTGTTEKVADMIAEKLKADMEEIIDTVDRSGARGYLTSGRDAMKRRMTNIEPAKNSPADYDLVIIGTPVWSWNLSVPVRTYLTQNKDRISKYAFFATMGGSGDKRATSEAADIIGKEAVANISFTTKEVVKGNFEARIDDFCTKLSLA
jgi:flavodoxin